MFGRVSRNAVLGGEELHPSRSCRQKLFGWREQRRQNIRFRNVEGRGGIHRVGLIETGDL